MQVVVEDSGVCRKKVNIEWPVERVQQSYDKILGEFGKMAKIKGFRPGKAPLSVVASRYKKEILEEIGDQLVPEGYHSAVKDNQLQVVQVLDVDRPAVTLGAPYAISITMEVAPEFTLPEYTGIPLQRNVEPVKDEEVDRLVQSVLEQFATYEEVSDRPVARGDMAEISFEGVCEGKPISELGEEVSGLDARQDFWVRVDENAFLPEFEAGLIGKEVGSKTEIAVDFAEDFSVKALAGKKATYFVDIKGIRERKMPEMNEEMLKMLQVDSEAAFRERVRADFKKRKESQADGKLRDDLAAHLLDAVQMDVPQTALQRESSQILRDMIRDNSQRGVPEAEMMENRDKLFEAASSSAERRVRLQFLLDRIAEKEEVQVTPAQMRDHINRLAPMYGMDAEKLKAELKKKDAMEDVENELRRSLVMDLLVEKANVTEVTGAE